MNDLKDAIILILFILWMSLGAFPLFCYEGDSNCVIAGCNILANEGFILPPVYSYRYDMQPGITIIVVLLKKILCFLSCSQVYSLLTLLSGILFVLFSISFAKKYVKTDIWVFVLSLFLLPESYAIITYPNSSIVAAVFFMGALLFIQNERLICSVPLLILAAIIRIDIIIVYPVIFLLLLLNNKGLSTTILHAFVLLFVSFCAIVLIYWLLNANPLNVAETAASYNQSSSLLVPVLMANLAYYSVNIILIPLGIIILCKNKRYQLVFMSLLPILLIHYFYRLNSTAAKHFLYTLPFDLIIVSTFWNYIFKQITRRDFKYAIAIALILFSLVSIRLSHQNYNKRHQYLASIGKIDFINRPISNGLEIKAGIGVGQEISTADEIITMSGNLFYPLYMHLQKKYLRENLHDILLNVKGDTVNVINVCYSDHYTLANLLFNDNYRYKKIDDLGTSYDLCGNRIFHFELYEVQEEKALYNLIENFYGKKENIYFITQYKHYMDRLDNMIEKGILENVSEGIYKYKQ